MGGSALSLPKYVLCRPTKLGADRDKIMSVRPIFTVRTALWNHLVQRQEIHFHLTIKNARRGCSCAVGMSVVIVFRDEICARSAPNAGRCSLFAVRCSLFAKDCERGGVCQAVLRVFRRFVIRLTADIQSFHVGFITWQGSCRQGLF